MTATDCTAFNDMFDQLLALQCDGKIDTALRKLFNDVENEALKDVSDLSTVDQLFIDERTKRFDKDLQVGLLVITLPWKSKFENREGYMSFVKSTLLEHYTDKQTERVLSGLR